MVFGKNQTDKKKVMFGFLFLIILIGILPLISAVKPLTSVQVNEGYFVSPTEKSAITYGDDHEFEVHVTNISNGVPITSGITCYMHLYHETGKHLYEGIDATASHTFDYSFDLNGTNFTSLGEYQAKFICNSSTLGGQAQLYFIVNQNGEELTEANSIRFNSAMFFMMLLFIMAIVGLFTIDNYIGKFVFYWVAHLIFVAGTFSMWKFNFGYATNFIGLAGVWKVMFYVSTIAILPVILFSMFWIFYIHTFNKHFEKIIRNGGNTEEAFRVADRKAGGWWNGKK